MTFGTMDRRRFLQLAGLGAGVAVAAPTVFGVERWLTGARRALKVGVMLPSGSRYPHASESFLDALHLGFEQARAAGSGIRPTFATADVVHGYGGARAAVRALLDDERADLVVAGVTAPVAAGLAGEFAERRVPLLVSNVGAHIVPPSDHNPYVLHNSLNYWQASFGMGAWAAKNLGRRALIATSAADAGYDTIYAFRQGMASAGGRLAGTLVTPAEPRAASRALLGAVRSRRPDFVYGLYSSDEAVSFVRAYERSGLGLPLAGSGFMVDSNTLGSHLRSAVGVTTCMPWSPSRPTQENTAFVQAFEARTGRKADHFALLGFDTANLVVAGAERAGRRGLGTSGMVKALSGVTVSTPRGMLSVDPETNVVLGPLFIQRIRAEGTGVAAHEIDVPPTVGAFPAAISGLERARAGYLNEYLCV